MKRIATSILFALAAITLTSSIAAQTLPQAGEAMGTAETQARTKAVTELDFEGDRVTGNPVRPLGENLHGERHPNRGSLIKIRWNFVPEMMRSVEDL